MSLSIIVPCFNEEKVLPVFINELRQVQKEIDEKIFELIFVDDGSTDQTLAVIKQLSEKDEQVKYISFSRNFGKEAAIYAGLQYSGGDYVAVMDADLQDPPGLLPAMYRAVKEEGVDAAAARRVSRKGEPWIRSCFAYLFYKLINRISETEIVEGARDYRLMNRRFVEALLELREYNRFSKGLYGWVGFQTKWIEYEYVDRAAGKSKWSFWKLLLYAIDGIVAFSTVPLVLTMLLGIFFGLLAIIFLIMVVVRKFVLGDPVQGWASTISIMLFMGGIQLFCIGIHGQYLAKTYMETKKRPVFIINEANIEQRKSENGKED